MSFFTLLGIDPTDNYEAVKKAYKKAALACHPDKNLGHELEAGEKMKTLNIAWRYFQNSSKPEEALREYYEKIIKGQNPDLSEDSSPHFDASARKPDVNLNIKKTGGLVDPSARVTVFIPIYITKLKQDGKTPRTSEQYYDYGPTFTPDEIRDQTGIFKLAAERITSHAKKAYYQVGIDELEPGSIALQHGYTQHTSGLLYVKANVRLLDLEEDRSSEADKSGPSALGARSGEYFSFRKDKPIQINENDIEAIIPADLRPAPQLANSLKMGQPLPRPTQDSTLQVMLATRRPSASPETDINPEQVSPHQEKSDEITEITEKNVLIEGSAQATSSLALQVMPATSKTASPETDSSPEKTQVTAEKTQKPEPAEITDKNVLDALLNVIHPRENTEKFWHKAVFGFGGKRPDADNVTQANANFYKKRPLEPSKKYETVPHGVADMMDTLHRGYTSLYSVNNDEPNPKHLLATCKDNLASVIRIAQKKYASPSVFRAPVSDELYQIFAFFGDDKKLLLKALNNFALKHPECADVTTPSQSVSPATTTNDQVIQKLSALTGSDTEKFWHDKVHMLGGKQIGDQGNKSKTLPHGIAKIREILASHEQASNQDSATTLESIRNSIKHSNFFRDPVVKEFYGILERYQDNDLLLKALDSFEKKHQVTPEAKSEAIYSLIK